MTSPTLAIEQRDLERLEGVVDTHVYCAPDMYERAFDEVEFARQARAVGYRGFISKSHHTMNADRLQFVRAAVPGIEAHGGVVLNYFVGGLNPGTVEVAIALGAKIVWMPNIHSQHHVRHFGKPGYSHLRRADEERGDSFRVEDYLTVLDEDGDLLPSVREIMDLIGQADIILGTGHLSQREVRAIAKAAPDHNVRKIVCAHVRAPVTNWSRPEQVEITSIPNVFLTHTFHRCIGDWFEVHPAEIAADIKAVGAERCIMASGLGASGQAHPIEGMRLFIRAMLRQGITEQEIETMTKRTPSELLNLP